jgi:hypothetical protein
MEPPRRSHEVASGLHPPQRDLRPTERTELYLEGGCDGTGIPGAQGCTPTSADGLLVLEPGKAPRWECAKLA